MKHVAAVLLLALANKEINEANINATLSSVGIKPNPTAVKLVLAAVQGKTPEQVNIFV
jgi:ribosomal protein L12E/L44/L45/RPP1/RPP2